MEFFRALKSVYISHSDSTVDVVHYVIIKEWFSVCDDLLWGLIFSHNSAAAEVMSDVAKYLLVIKGYSVLKPDIWMSWTCSPDGSNLCDLLCTCIVFLLKLVNTLYEEIKAINMWLSQQGNQGTNKQERILLFKVKKRPKNKVLSWIQMIKGIISLVQLNSTCCCPISAPHSTQTTHCMSWGY